MTNRKFHLYIFIAFIPVLVAAPAFSQKRKSTTDVKSNDGRLREAEFFFTEAEKYFILEDYAKALVYFQRVAELNPTNGTVHYKIAEILAKGTKNEDILKASQSIELALKYEKKNKYFYVLASTIYASLGAFDKATDALETMMKEVKGTEEYLFELAALYLYDKKEDAALKIYNRAEDIMGVNEVSSLQKQRIYLERGKVTEAIAEGEKLLQAFPDEERYALGFAEALAGNEQRSKAIQLLEDFIKDHPDAGNSKMVLAGLYKDVGQEQKSRNYVMEVFDDPQVDISSKVLMMGTYNATLSQNRTRKISDPELEKFVIGLFEKLESNYPTESNVHLIGGDLYMTLEKDDAAKREYLRAVRGGTSNFEAWQNLLYLETQSDQIDSLIVHSEEALEMFPNQAMIYYFNGFGHLRKRNYKEAAYSLEQSKKLSATNPTFMSELNGILGDCYNGSKEYAKSDQAYEEALKFNPNNDLVLNNYSYYLSLRKENLDKAEKMSSQLIKNFPDNASYLDTHAWVLYAREKYKEAKKIIERAIQNGQATATHYEHYGDILFQLGDIDNAVKQWQKAKQRDGGNASLDKKINSRKLN
ncbi:MAG: tetratricopeptide repeat protein [Cyclobacteriaceae bacterium]|nr:tetratricopeptide repeat protein [Cyclobacteriaceae bacterium]